MKGPPAKKVVRYGFLLIAIGFGVWAVAGQWSAVTDAFARLSWFELAASLIAVVGALIAGMLMWRALLADLGSPLRFPDAARIFFVGQLGKYIPGSLWPVLAQMEMGRDHGIPRTRSASAFFLTYPIYLASGLTVALATLPLLAGDSVSQYGWLLLLIPVLVAGLQPGVVNWAINKALRLARKPPLPTPLTRRGIVTSTGWAFAGWLAYGIHLAIIVHGLGASGWQAALLSCGAFALAWCLGFLVVIAPAGAGVREVAMVAALAPVLDRGSAIAAALCSRLIVSVGDFVCAAIAGAVTKKRVNVTETVE
ncbi:flippase-like domain-containing protein [Streptosporangiaceae bacterium NEAU-GS5]|nr:flippase-like domain-containing protein [Streptosporangiaceae bacterium NEAU-GS5]